MSQYLPEPCCSPMAFTIEERECVVLGVLCLQLGPEPRWGRGQELLCREAESFYHFQDPIHPFLLINGSWLLAVASGRQNQQGTHWDLKSCQGSFILTQTSV